MHDNSAKNRTSFFPFSKCKSSDFSFSSVVSNWKRLPDLPVFINATFCRHTPKLARLFCATRQSQKTNGLVVRLHSILRFSLFAFSQPRKTHKQPRGGCLCSQFGSASSGLLSKPFLGGFLFIFQISHIHIRFIMYLCFIAVNHR